MSNHLTAIAGSNDVAATTAAVSNRIAERRPLIKGALTFFSIKESERDAAHDLVDIERYSRPNHIREAIEKGELVLAAHRSMIGDLSAALVPVTLKDIAVETGDLVLAFPGRDDLAEFTQLLFDHILIEHPLRLVLVVACHHLRCTSKFRPAISEVMEEIAETVSRLRSIKSFADLEENLDKAHAHLSRIEAERAAERAAELAKPRFVVDYRPHDRWYKFSLIDRHDERKPVVKHFRDTDAVIEFMKTADPATTECGDKTKAELLKAEMSAINHEIEDDFEPITNDDAFPPTDLASDAESDRDAANVFPSARSAVGATRAA